MTKFVFGIPVCAAARSLLFAASLMFLAGCASDGGGGNNTALLSQSVGSAGPDSDVGEIPDTLRVGELISIDFTGVEVPPPHYEDRIKSDGRISLPSLGPIEAAGKTRGELEKEIHDRYVPAFYQRLTVTVRNEGRFFYVKGQVKMPNRYPYLTKMTVLRAIAAAGDFTDFAKKTKVLVTRGADGRKELVNCNRAMHDPRLDLPIYPDDTIEVPRRYF